MQLRFRQRWFQRFGGRKIARFKGGNEIIGAINHAGDKQQSQQNGLKAVAQPLLPDAALCPASLFVVRCMRHPWITRTLYRTEIVHHAAFGYYVLFIRVIKK